MKFLKVRKAWESLKNGFTHIPSVFNAKAMGNILTMTVSLATIGGSIWIMHQTLKP